MDTVYSWAITVTVCAVIACIMEMISGGTKLMGTVRLVTGLFMICSAILPAAELFRDLSFTDLSPEDVIPPAVLDTENAEKKLICEKLRELTEKTLAAHDIYPLSSDIQLDIDETGKINAVHADILMDNSNAPAADEAALIIRRELGIECTVRTSSVR